MRTYTWVDGDTHLEVSPDRWRNHVDARYREYVPTVVQLPTGGDAWQIPGKQDLVPLGLNLCAGFARGERWDLLRETGVSYAENPAGTGGPEQRLAEMDEDNVDAAILFPAVQGQRTINAGAVPREAHIGIVQGYNNWLSSEFCAADPDRLLGVAILPPTGVEDATAELYRVAELPGIRTVILHQWPNGGPTPDDELDERFWSAADETGMPISVHVSFGGGREADAKKREAERNEDPRLVKLNRPHAISLMSRLDRTGYNAIQLIATGVLDRHPSLRIHFAESSASWVPYVINTADSDYVRHGPHSQLELPKMPSEYFKDRFLWGIQDDYAAIKMRDMIGVDNIAWSTDFPHAACDWPLSMKIADRLFADVPADEVKKMRSTNLVNFYKLASTN